MQRFIAKNGPFRVWCAVCVLAGPVIVWCNVQPVPWLLNHWVNLPAFIAILLVAGLVGLVAAPLLGLPFLFEIYNRQAKRNGAPFAVGDTVRILAGPFADRVAPVDAVWEERGQVRVVLGDRERERFEDVFGEYQVCREPNPET